MSAHFPNEHWQNLLRLLAHDIHKPLASVRMFLDVLPQIGGDSEQVVAWSAGLIKNFDDVEAALRAFREVVAKETSELEFVRVQDLITEANESFGYEALRWSGSRAECFECDPSLMRVFFANLPAALGVRAQEATPIRLSWNGRSEKNRRWMRVDHPALQERASVTGSLSLSGWLCEHVLRLHGADLELRQEPTSASYLAFEIDRERRSVDRPTPPVLSSRVSPPAR